MELYIPKLEDYWYEQKLNEDKDSMSYNAGWDVSYYGYNKEDGTIKFPKERWLAQFERRKSKDKFFAYLVENGEFVGYCNYNVGETKTTCGILVEHSKRGKGYSKEGLKLLIEEARKNNIKSMYDDFEEDRFASKIFYDLGFVKTNEYEATKFDKKIKVIEVKIEL